MVDIFTFPLPKGVHHFFDAIPELIEWALVPRSGTTTTISLEIHLVSPLSGGTLEIYIGNTY
jgi:hypothetical protein